MHPAMLVVPVPEPGSGAPLQGVSGVEGPAEDPVGGGAEGDWEAEGTVEDLGPPGGEVRAWVLDFLSTMYVGRRVPTEEEAVSEVSEAELREFLEEQGAGAEEPGAVGTPQFLPTPDFMASAGEG